MLSFTSRRGACMTLTSLIIAVLFTVSFYYFSFPESASRLIEHLPFNPSSKPAQSGRVCATFLSTRLQNDDEYDAYFLATRVLAYQLLYHPSTKTNLDIPFLVIVPPHVSETKVKQLEKDGAMVIRVEDLNPSTNWTVAGDERFIDQFTKLRLFQLTQFEQILYIDSDTLLTRSLDDIWSEPAVRAISTPRQRTANDTSPLPGDAKLPEWYSIAGIPDADADAYLARTAGAGAGTAMLNGGFFALRPNDPLFRYYTALLDAPHSFDSRFMEQALLNRAHRPDGPMPWAALEAGVWSCNWPTPADLDRRCRSLHDKFWAGGREEVLVAEWWRMVGAMEGYWLGKRGSERWW